MTTPAEAESLSVVGLTPTERTAYELLIDRPSDTLADLAAGWDRPEPLAEVLAGLEERSLVIRLPGAPVRFRPAPPATAFAALFADYEEQLEQARRHVGMLTAAYRARPAAPDTGVVEVVTGGRAVRQRWLQIRRGARRQISCLARPPYLSGVTGRPTHEADHQVTWRTIYDRPAIEHSGALAAVERSIRAGRHARVLPDLPISLYLVDARIALLPLPRHPAGTDAGLVLHPSALLDAQVTLFEGLWQRALPLHPPASGRATSGAGPRGRLGPDRLITLLLSGLTDQAVARQFGVSHRTVQRQVSALMSDLGAHSRFQAGVRAALQRLRTPPGTAAG